MDIKLDTAYAKFQTLRTAVGHRPWRPGMPMERALEELGAALGELKRTREELARAREELLALRRDPHAGCGVCAELETRPVAVQDMETVGRLASSVAHDFNNLLFIIMGRSQLLLERLSARDPNRKHAREIRKVGRRGASLARQLLALSRPSAAGARALDSYAAIEGTRELLELVVGDAIALELRPDPEAGAIEIERGRLEQILLNLTMNARDAMPEGGTLSITSERRAPADRDREAGDVVIGVRDSGLGMDEATRARVFEPYFTTKAPGRGTGLGLASVKSAVREHGGWISVDSAPGRGSRFELGFPVAARRRDPREEKGAADKAPAPAS